MALSSSQEAPQPLGQVVRSLKEWVQRTGEIWVRAQVIEIRRRSQPTQFLTFRDRSRDVSATVTCSAFVLDAAGPLPEGSEVVARLRARLWEPTTSLSFECLELQVAGQGRLLAELEQLKRKLQSEGLFDPACKRRLPFLPGKIGLVTGRASDAERDVLRNVERRWPVPVRVEHALMQGPESANSIIQALRTLADDESVVVIVLARGGGSLEDLLSFSDEQVVRAVAACPIPVISAIGHEADTPLVDFVADVRASTPTDAAKIVVPDLAAESEWFDQSRNRLRSSITALLRTAQDSLTELRSRPVLASPASAFSAHFDQLKLLRHRLTTAIARRLAEAQTELVTALTAIRALSPQATLQRGYSLLFDETSQAVTSTASVEPGDRLTAQLAAGRLELEVTCKKEKM